MSSTVHCFANHVLSRSEVHCQAGQRVNNRFSAPRRHITIIGNVKVWHAGPMLLAPDWAAAATCSCINMLQDRLAFMSSHRLCGPKLPVRLNLAPTRIQEKGCMLCICRLAGHERERSPVSQPGVAHSKRRGPHHRQRSYRGLHHPDLHPSISHRHLQQVSLCHAVSLSERQQHSWHCSRQAAHLKSMAWVLCTCSTLVAAFLPGNTTQYRHLPRISGVFYCSSICLSMIAGQSSPTQAQRRSLSRPATIRF